MLNPNFPDVISIFKLFEIFSWYNINLFNEIEDKGYFFKLLICKRIQIFLDRALACFESIKFDFSHATQLAHMRTLFKLYLLYWGGGDSDTTHADRENS